MLDNVQKKISLFSIFSHRKQEFQLDSLELSRGCIRIVPTRSGLLFLGIATAVLLAAYNYKNSLAYFLGFLMINLFLISIVYCYKNLSGLRISSASAPSAFVGESALFPIRLEGKHRDYYGIIVDSEQNELHKVDVHKGDEVMVDLLRDTLRRGLLSLGQFKLTSCYPLGLLRGSAWINLSQTLLVYPRPIDPKFLPPQSTISGEHGEENIADTGDFHGLRAYQAGDRMNQIAWKMVSKGQGMYCKQFSEPVGKSQLLSLNDLNQYQLETALSYLCHWVLQAHQNGESYGLNLGNVVQPMGNGNAHLKACLTLLGKV